MQTSYKAVSYTPLGKTAAEELRARWFRGAAAAVAEQQLRIAAQLGRRIYKVTRYKQRKRVELQ